MGTPIVSIIIPNFNHAPFLKPRLDSVFNQTYQDFEVILLDDASTDGSARLLTSYQDHPKVSHIVLNTINSRSPFKQWSQFIGLTQGEFIWIAETDDFADIEFLERTVTILESRPNSSLVYTDARIIDENANSLGFWSEEKNLFFKTKRWSKTHDADGKDEILNYLLYKVTINNVSSVLFRSKHLKESHFLNQLIEFRTAGDLFTYLNMALKGDISYCHLALNNYRKHSKNVTITNTRSGIIYKERLHCYLKIINDLGLTGNIDFKKQNKVKPFMFILKKNVFHALDFNHYNELMSYISALLDFNVINKVEYNFYIVLFRFYKWNHLKSKQISRRIIKAMVNK